MNSETNRIVTLPDVDVVTDFDGTVVRVNSFPRWIMYVLIKSLITFRWSITIRVMVSVGRRKVLGTITHSQFKDQVNQLEYPMSWRLAFCYQLRRNLSVSTYTLIEKLLANEYCGQTLIVATAAPSCYAECFGEVFFPELDVQVLSSCQIGDEFVDNSGMSKVKNVMQTIGHAPKVFLTDSIDDLPLARLARDVYLCNPLPNAIKCFNEAGISYVLIEG